MDRMNITGNVWDYTLHVWYAKPPWAASVDQTELRLSILADARAATEMKIAPQSAGGSLPVLIGETWAVEMNGFLNHATVYIDAWNGSERVIFWVDATEVKDLMERVAWKCSRCGCGGASIVYGPNPYEQDVNGDETPVLLCLRCIDILQDEI